MIKKIILDPLVIVLFILTLLIFITWIPHEAYSEDVNFSFIPEDGSYKLIDLPILICIGFIQMFDIFLYVLSIGILFSILNKYNSFEIFVDDVLKGVNGNKFIFTTLLFSLIFILSSILGFFEQFIVLMPMLWVSFEKIGIKKDKSTVIVILAACFGRAFSTTSPYGLQIAYESLNEDILNLYGGEINKMFAFRFVLMFIGMIFSIIFINYFIIRNEEKDGEFTSSNILTKEINNFNKKIVYLNLFLFLVLVVLLMITSLFFNNYIKCILILCFAIMLKLIFHFTNSNFNNESQFIKPLLSLIKVYAVFSISKSISILLIYSGFVGIMTSWITWKSSSWLLMISIIPIIFIISMLMNSQTGLMVIFSPILAEIIGKSGFDNPDLVFNVAMSIVIFITGFNSSFTPTQSFNTISIQRSNIGYKKYISYTYKINSLMFFIFPIILFPIISLF